jgi:hypothetical protein
MTAREKSILRIQSLLHETDDCIIGFPLNHHGYVQFAFRDNERQICILGHRLSYEMHNNVTIDKSVVICHTCDNAACINPMHLFIGTHADNVRDKVNKGRQAKGEKNGRYTKGYYSKYDPVERPKTPFEKLHSRKFNEEQMREIKKLIKNRGDKSLKTISKELNISYYTVRDISCGRGYKTIII